MRNTTSLWSHDQHKNEGKEQPGDLEQSLPHTVVSPFGNNRSDKEQSGLHQRKLQKQLHRPRKHHRKLPDERYLGCSVRSIEFGLSWIARSFHTLGIITPGSINRRRVSHHVPASKSHPESQTWRRRRCHTTSNIATAMQSTSQNAFISNSASGRHRSSR
jgi:hypothetical protein